MHLLDFAEKVQKIMLMVTLSVVLASGALAFLLANAHFDLLVAVGISVATVVAMSVLPLPWEMIEERIAHLLAKLQRLQLCQYQANRNGVSYFLFADDVGIRYFRGIGALGNMQIHDFLNEHELATLKSGELLPY